MVEDLMRELNQSLHAFIEAIHSENFVILTPYGQWEKENKVIVWIRQFLGLETRAQVGLVKAFNSILDSLEETPVVFSRNAGVLVSQPFDFHGYLNAAQSIRRSLKNHEHPLLKKELTRLKLRILALMYRLEQENGGLTRAKVESPPQFLVEAAKDWKCRQKIFWNTDLSPREIQQLTEVARYKSFLDLLLVDEELRGDFFAWSLRDALPAGPYVEFPNQCEKLTLYNMRGRIGKMGFHFLRIKKVDSFENSLHQQKVVTLPFEGIEMSILDDNSDVVFKGEYRVKIKQVFSVFRDKAIDLGNFEIFAQGILNWNSNCMGWWNNTLRAYELVNLDQRDWWRQLPILEVLTLEEAKKRFKSELDGERWLLVAKSARESLNLDYDRSHAYVEMVIPTEDRQCYIIYTFGKAMTSLPRNFWHRLFLFGAHVPATIVYPDETMYFTHRQQIGYTFELTEAEGLRLMDAFRLDMQRAREGNIVFQLEAENCGKWLQNHLEEHLGNARVPNLYRSHLLDAEPTGFMAKFFAFFKGLPRFCRHRMFMLIHYPLGAWRGRWVVDTQGKKVWKSLINSSFWQDAITYLPAYLHKQHEAGVFKDESGHKIWIERESGHQQGDSPSSENPRLFEDF